MYIYRELTYNIIINTTEHTLSLFEADRIHKIYPVAVGKATSPTPRGNFTIVNKSLNPGGPFGVRWMGLSINHYGIHGTNNSDSIGNSVSNGCIRMYNEDVIELYDFVSIGTTVEII